MLLEYHKMYAVKMAAFSALIHEIRENRLQLPEGWEESSTVGFEQAPPWVGSVPPPSWPFNGSH